MRVDVIAPQLVELAPKLLEQGVFYISQKYRVAVHLCCCGCGEKVVTPLSPAEWQLDMREGMVTLHPSIGNSTPCRSHYWVRQNSVVWAPKMTAQQIHAVRNRDLASLSAMHASRYSNANRPSWITKMKATMKAALNWLRGPH